MRKLLCPITKETILTVSDRGVRQRENYAEVFFILDDRSSMRVALSKNAKKSLTKKQANHLLEVSLSSTRKIAYTNIIDRNGKPITLRK